MADLQPSYHGSKATLGNIITDLYLFFALLQASTGGRLDKTVSHKGILRDFFGVTLPVNHSDDVTNDAGHVPLILFCNWLFRTFLSFSLAGTK